MDRTRGDGLPDGQLSRQRRLRHPGVRPRPGPRPALAAEGVQPEASSRESATAADARRHGRHADQVEASCSATTRRRGARPGAAIVVMATVGPGRSPAGPNVPPTAGRAGRRTGVRRRRPRRAAGDLLIMVGGPEPVVARVRPLLDAWPAAPRTSGPPRRRAEGQLVNQLLCGVHIAAAAEALALAGAMDLDPAAT